MKTLFCIFILSFLSIDFVAQQHVQIINSITMEPVEMAIVTNNHGQLLGYSNAEGKFSFQSKKGSTSACVRAFGYYDTCLVVNKMNTTIQLRPFVYETAPVEISAKTKSAEEEFLNYYRISMLLLNKKEEPAFQFDFTRRPEETTDFDRITGTFHYTQPSYKINHRYKVLHLCEAERTVTKKLEEDTVLQEVMRHGNSLPNLIWSMGIPSNKTYQHLKKIREELHIRRSSTDSLKIFKLYFADDLQNEAIWHFDYSGRLQQIEWNSFTQKKYLEKHPFLPDYTYGWAEFSNIGNLTINKLEATLIFNKNRTHNYTAHITLSALESVCNEVMHNDIVPMNYSFRTWARVTKIPTTIVEE